MKVRPFCLAIVFGCGVVLGSAAAAQVDGAAPSAILPPSSPRPKSPVDIFRELLAMSSAERRSAVSKYSSEVQPRLLTKLAEYESLSPNERELRLKVTELTWYLWRLIATPSTNRTAVLENAPEDIRQLAAQRIEDWDKLSPTLQNEIRTIRDVTDPPLNPAILTPERKQELEKNIAEWRALPETQRQRALQQFDALFGLKEQEKERVLSSLSEPERRKIEKVIDSFAKLTSADRARCINGLARFTSLSVPERIQFLKNAERWKAMSPNQREAWVQSMRMYSLRPPLPPGLGTPPMPRVPRPSPAVRAVVTNSN